MKPRSDPFGRPLPLPMLLRAPVLAQPPHPRAGASAWLCLHTRGGELVSIRCYSEPTPTCMRGDRYFVLAHAHARSYAKASDRLEQWWTNRRPWQKRAILGNATLLAMGGPIEWKPAEVEARR